MNKGPVPQGAQKEEPWREVARKTFNLARMESAYSRKMTKRKAAKKVSLKKWVWKRWEALKEERLEVSSLGTPQNGKSARGFWGKSTKRRKLYETRNGPATKVASTTLALVPKKAKERNQWYPKTLGWHYKKRKQPTVKGHSATVDQNRIIEKILLKTQTK